MGKDWKAKNKQLNQSYKANKMPVKGLDPTQEWINISVFNLKEKKTKKWLVCIYKNKLNLDLSYGWQDSKHLLPPRYALTRSQN